MTRELLPSALDLPSKIVCVECADPGRKGRRMIFCTTCERRYERDRRKPAMLLSRIAKFVHGPLLVAAADAFARDWHRPAHATARNSPSLAEQAVGLVLEGRTAKSAAAEVGVASGACLKACRRAGIVLRRGRPTIPFRVEGPQP